MHLPFAIIEVSRRLKKALDQRLEEKGITAAQFAVLNQVANQNGKITSAQVAENIKTARPTVSGIVRRLEEKHKLQILDNPNDRRSHLLHLNQQNLKFVLEIREICDQLSKDVFIDLTAEEKQTLEGLIHEISNQLRRIND